MSRRSVALQPRSMLFGCNNANWSATPISITLHQPTHSSNLYFIYLQPPMKLIIYIFSPLFQKGSPWKPLKLSIVNYSIENLISYELQWLYYVIIRITAVTHYHEIYTYYSIKYILIHYYNFVSESKLWNDQRQGGKPVR
jgi:hypothetical protein